MDDNQPSAPPVVPQTEPVQQPAIESQQATTQPSQPPLTDAVPPAPAVAQTPVEQTPPAPVVNPFAPSEPQPQAPQVTEPAPVAAPAAPLTAAPDPAASAASASLAPPVADTATYIELIKSVIEAQEAIIGPLAIQRAQQVEGIAVDPQTKAVTLTCPPTEALDRLVNQYSVLFGQISIEVCRDAAARFSGKVSSEQLPASLR